MSALSEEWALRLRELAESDPAGRLESIEEQIAVIAARIEASGAPLELVRLHRSLVRSADEERALLRAESGPLMRTERAYLRTEMERRHRVLLERHRDLRAEGAALRREMEAGSPANGATRVIA
jgi:hypothetical protein